MEILRDARSFREPFFVRRRDTCVRLSRHSRRGAGNTNGGAHGSRGLVMRRDRFASQLADADAVEHNEPTVESMLKPLVTDLHVASCLTEIRVIRHPGRGPRG